MAAVGVKVVLLLPNGALPAKGFRNDSRNRLLHDRFCPTGGGAGRTISSLEPFSGFVLGTFMLPV